jgi:ribosomal protein S3AE
MAVLKKHWVPVLAPALFKSEQLGESYVLETDTLKNRSITVNLMNITGDMKKQNLGVSFKIVNVKEGKAHTRVTGVNMQSGSIKRLVRRGRNKIDDSFAVTLKGGQIARVKPLIITKTLTNNSTATAVRVKARELLQEVCKELTFETLVSDVVNMKLQRYLRTSLNSIYPIRSVDIRSCALMPKYTVDEEQPVEESTYQVATEVADEDGERS